MLKKYKIESSNFDIEPHEVFMDKLARYKEEEFGLSENKFEVPLKEKISYVLFCVFFVLALVLFSRVFHFQVFQGKGLYIQAENNKGSVNLVVPTRGVIYDKNMTQLVLNSPAYDLICDRAYFAFSSPQVDEEIKNISDIMGLEQEEIKNKILNTDSSDVLIEDNIIYEKLLILETKINDLLGCRVRQNTTRNYVYGSIFSQVLGYTGRINKDEYSSKTGYSINDYIGKTGLEKYYETYLRGENGQSYPEKSGSKNGVILAPIPGNNIVLNIDAGLQERLYNALEKSIKNVGAKKGAAVAMDPRTGAVLALISYPSYDNNSFSGGISKIEYDKIINNQSQPLFNRAISAKYPTGSTIKPLEAAAALQEKLISPDKQINDIGYILVKNQYDPNIVYKYTGVKPHGWVDMKKAIAVSSNIYFYTIGAGYEDQKGLGPTKIKDYLSLFGWDQRTGIDLPGEFSGFIPDPAWKKAVKNQPWWDGDTYNLAIGQSDLQTTPLQVASAYCVIANGGILYKPQIVNKIIYPSAGSGQVGETIQEFSPQIVRSNFIDAENLKIVREGMRDAVNKSYGGATILNNLPVAVAAKTGTAEIGINNYFNVWSSVFAPYENPEIVLVVTVENVEGFGAVTLPVAHEVLNWYFSKK